MDFLKLDRPDPTFIIDINSRKVFHANEAAVKGCDRDSPIGHLFDKLVHTERNVTKTFFPTFFDSLWYNLIQEPLSHKERSYARIILKKRQAIPDLDHLRTLKRMISTLLQRLRSPLTGIQGYLDLIRQSLPKDAKQKRLTMVADGITQLFDIFDELESLEKAPLSFDGYQTHTTNAEVIVRSLLIDYPSNIREQIQFKCPQKSSVFNCQPIVLKRILGLLLDNAVEHCSNTPYAIYIDFPSDQSIKISHHGTPIPEFIRNELFFPFITHKANNLGIGLTMALLYANQCRGSIFLTDNNANDGISFSLCFPPRSN